MRESTPKTVGAELTPENLPLIRPAITRADKIP